MTERVTPGDEWRTPPYIYLWLKKRYRFTVDLAASDKNALEGNYFTVADDALQASWHEESRGPGWLNPPYSDTARWLEKARDEACSGFTTVMLLPSANGERHYGQHVFGIATEVIFITGRLSFLDQDGRPVPGNRAGSMIAIYEGFNLGDTRYRHMFRDQIPGAPKRTRRTA